MPKAKDLISSQADQDQQLRRLDETKLGGAKNLLGFYNGKSTIYLGEAGGSLVVQDFKIHEDYLVNVFNRQPTLASIAITTAPKNSSSITPRESRDTTATEDGNKRSQGKGRINTGFQGQRIRIPIPATIGMTLRNNFFSPGGVARTKPRKNVFVTFPKAAHQRAICLWIATHVEVNKLDDFGVFYTQSGTKVSFDPAKYNVEDATAITALLGKFSTKYKMRLFEQKAV